MSESKRMSSIARKINWYYWVRLFSALLGTDILIVLGLCGSYIYRFTEIGYKVWYLTGEQLLEMFVWIKTYALIPCIVIGANELIILIRAFADASEVRKRLKPINDLAIKAEKISRINLNDLNDPMTESRPEQDTAKKREEAETLKKYREKEKLSKKDIENLGHAIDNISPDALEKGIHTGDSDLQGIEVALNNLLIRMRENQKQQARFVSDASHELRTPIAVIQGYVNMLDRWGKTDEAILNESIEALKNESDHMKTLIEQLLFLARGDSGRNTLNRVDFDLNDVVRDVFEESMMIDQNHVYVFKELPDVVMNGDIGMVKQSMRIFIQNAAKYSDAGDTITLKVLNNNGVPGFSIQDEGIGMQESDVAHIFERFYRSDDARNSETGGTGLGLSIAKWIVDAHNGNIEVLSRPGFGTRFTVSF